MSSISTIRTLGAPAGASTSNRGGGVALRALNTVLVGTAGSGIGSIVRSVGSTTLDCATTRNVEIGPINITRVSTLATTTAILFMTFLSPDLFANSSLWTGVCVVQIEDLATSTAIIFYFASTDSISRNCKVLSNNS
jgi:hypothetical protein